MASPRRHDLFRRSVTAGALGAGAILSARALLRPQATANRKLIDWEAVRRLAAERSGEAQGANALDAERLAATYNAIAAEVSPLLAEVCQVPLTSYPRFVALDRRGFIDANLLMVQRLLEPVERLRATMPESVATALGRRVLDRYVGELFGLMSRRVLGQYDPVLTLVADAEVTLPASALYLVEPNIGALERDMRLQDTDLRAWLILHELTHAWQFELHPWLRDHIVSLMRGLMLDALSENGATLLPSHEMVRRLPGTVRAQLRTVGRVQAVMSVLEGYSNFVMHRASRGRLRGADRLESAMHTRRRQRTALERLVLVVTGLEMKLRQYEVGEKFAGAVVDRAGLTTLNRVWESTAMMPSPDELAHPERWIRRVG